jgi:hypothetical protein
MADRGRGGRRGEGKSREEERRGERRVYGKSERERN